MELADRECYSLSGIGDKSGMRMNKAIEEAYRVLDGVDLRRELADTLSMLNGSDILDLVSLANKVRETFTDRVHLCTIMNARSGRCSEDCRFCAQSAHHGTNIEEYPLLDREEMVKRAQSAYETGVRSFGIVTSGLGFLKADRAFQAILKSIDDIYRECPGMSVCASLGILSEETARALAERGIVHYNINIQTNPDRYGELISTTHDVKDRIETIRLLKKYGVKVCCGGIIGLGESMADRLELAYAVKDLDVDVIPLNVLIPLAGTPLEGRQRILAAEVAKTFALFRLINPNKIIKFAAGRETRMKDFQGLLMLAGVNGFLTGGYLTTRGREVSEDFIFKSELNGFGSYE